MDRVKNRCTYSSRFAPVLKTERTGEREGKAPAEPLHGAAWLGRSLARLCPKKEFPGGVRIRYRTPSDSEGMLKSMYLSILLSRVAASGRYRSRFCIALLVNRAFWATPPGLRCPPDEALKERDYTT